jgi:cellulose synthase/poly-beta-1,6-N-acetylglucosamine synthase-like glycosyltransferase
MRLWCYCWAICRCCGRCGACRCRCPTILKEWPAVDVLIPTLNEPLSVVRFTALAAMNIDWPAEKLNVYILDDGRREEFRAFAEEAGIGIHDARRQCMPRRATSTMRWSS